MKRFIIIVACALLMLPTSSAFAGTWSWHSDLVQRFLEKLQEHQGGRSGETVKPLKQAPPTPAKVPRR